MSSNSVYDMRLHDTVSLFNGEIRVIKVHGGWIYESWRQIAGHLEDWEPYATVFVPEGPRS